MPSLIERLEDLGISHLYTSAGRVHAGDPSAGLYGSAPLADVLAALDLAEETGGGIAERFAAFHGAVRFAEPPEGRVNSHYQPHEGAD
jgi:hypothetical protein